MARRGRKPLATEHLDKLDGSQRAKERLAALLMTLGGQWTIPEACAQLGLSEARFHALRHTWLEEALQLLEPRPLGRPPRRADQQAAATEALEQRVEQLERELALSETRREVAPLVGSATGGGEKKRRRSS